MECLDLIFLNLSRLSLQLLLKIDFSLQNMDTNHEI